MKNKTQAQILKEYEQKTQELIQKMFQVWMRAQRKVDDEAYRKALEKIQ